jgi:formylglycine-generating enzyme required for sulfatase activity
MGLNNYLVLFSFLMDSLYFNETRFQTDGPPEETHAAQLILERDLREHFFMDSKAAALIASAVRNAFGPRGRISQRRYLEEIKKALRQNEQGERAYTTQAAQTGRNIPAVKNDMLNIPGGVSVMGTGRWAKKSHAQERRVNVAPFLMSKYTVLQDEFENIMGYNSSYIKGAEFPAESICWYEAVEYCNRRSLREDLTPAYIIDKENPPSDYDDDQDNLKWNVIWDRSANGYRLPTEAEWEYACRAGTASDFYTGNFINTEQANYNNNHIMPAGQFAPNPWGLSDMHGNIWEWCWDSPWDGYSAEIKAHTPGRLLSLSKYKRIVRGGAYCYGSTSISSWYTMIREQYRLGYMGPYGIRLVRSKKIWFAGETGATTTIRSLKDG